MTIFSFLAIYIAVFLLATILRWSLFVPVRALRNQLEYHHSYVSGPRKAGLKVQMEASLSSLPAWLPLAFLLTEDPGFYNHDGFSFPEMKRRLWLFITRKGRAATGSTISQQLMKFIFTFGEPTPARKLKEAVLTTRLERNFSKDEILTLYLNNACLGKDIFGVSSACWHYFQKPVEEITLRESVILALLVRKSRANGPRFQNGDLPAELQTESFHKIQHIHLIYALYLGTSYPYSQASSSSSEVSSLLERFNQTFTPELLCNSAGREITGRTLDDYVDLVRDQSRRKQEWIARS